MNRWIFVNLAVEDLSKSVEFFTKLGFTFNADFTNETSTMMNVSETAKIMLLTKPFFQTFTPKQIADSNQTAEVLVSISANSKEEVDELCNKAFAAGGKKRKESAEDEGFMYSWEFEDLDGHNFGVVWMDPTTIA